LIKDIHRRQSNPEITYKQSELLKAELLKLNKDLLDVKEKLIDYLAKIQDKEILGHIVNEDIKKLIYEPFNPKDFSVKGQNGFSEFIKRRFDDFRDERFSRAFLLKYPQFNEIMDMSDIRFYLERDGLNRDKHEEFVRSPHMRNVVPWTFLIPDNILFLNFNYTRTASLYLGRNKYFPLNHIHGELHNPEVFAVKNNNPIIFGYGDEIDENYKKIAEQNDNEYLQNIKSIRYLETDNYRRLLTFIDSAPYQIYIMGHSCGNSDRTLLNTLFEHENCISIKPFYYKKTDGSDDYIDIVQNISRNFKNPTLMRDRVVNKTYCEALPQNR
jgi:hypothetical protein